MKKLFILFAVSVIAFSCAESRDYTKLQVKEMKHAQKYGTTQKVLQNQDIKLVQNTINTANIKDPKIMKFGHYDLIPEEKYNKKMKADEKEYKEVAKILGKTASKHYKTQADAIDFYKVYRVAEKLIRANKLDYLNWRIEIYKDSVSTNAYSTNTNYIAVSTSLIDNFGDNEDVMALVLGHEMGHALLGHQERTTRIAKQMAGQYKEAADGNPLSALLYIGMKQKYNTDSKNMEYAADVEGAKLAMRAGFNLDNSTGVMSYFSSLPHFADWKSDHPNPVKRLENLRQNVRYFPKEWNEIGKVNIYNSNVLQARLSSDRKSMVISAPAENLSKSNYYNPESMDELYARLGYMCYINGEFGKSLHYFGELFKIDTTNAPAYLYASYAAEYLYNSTKDSKYINLAKDYAQRALSLEPDNKYFKEQADAL